MLVSTEPGVWVAALATLACFSYLYKDNPVWKFTEHAYVGMSAAYTVGNTFHVRIKPTIMDDLLTRGYWSYVIPILIGLAIYTRFSPSLTWISRYPLSLWVGYGAGLTLSYSVPPMMGQVTGTFRTLTTVNDWIYWLGVVCTLMYFFFTVSRENPVVKYGASAGRWIIMIGLGASFGNTVIYRYNLMLQRMNMLFIEWLQIAG